MTADFWLWLTTALMTAGGLAILAVGKQRTPGEQVHTVLHGIVPIIAACSYFAMATGQGSMTLPVGAAPDTGRLFYFARYVDWTFTTPLLLLTLAYTAMHTGLRRGGMLMGMILSDGLMIATALFFGLSEVPWIKWAWFLISCVSFLGVYYVIWGPMLADNRKERAAVQSAYRESAGVLTVLWLLYPVVLALGTDGLGAISPAASVAGIAILDVLSKVAYGLWTTVKTSRLAEEDLGSAATVRPAYGTAD